MGILWGNGNGEAMSRATVLLKSCSSNVHLGKILQIIQEYYALVQGQRGFRLRAVIYLGVGPENIGPSIQSL